MLVVLRSGGGGSGENGTCSNVVSVDNVFTPIEV